MLLSRRELRWLPWLPLLLAEGLYARLATARLPAARDPAGRAGAGPGLRLVGVGDSIVAGVGVERHVEGLVGQVASLVATRYATGVEWQALGEAGATSATIGERLLPQALPLEPHLVVLSCGVNDAVSGITPAGFKRNLREIVAALTAGRARPGVVFAGIPPLASFPALPWPLSRLLDDRARALQQAAVELTGFRSLKVVNFPARVERSAFARDGFHPGPRGCAAWARWVTDGMAAGIDALGVERA